MQPSMWMPDACIIFEQLRHEGPSFDARGDEGAVFAIGRLAKPQATITDSRSCLLNSVIMKIVGEDVLQETALSNIMSCNDVIRQEMTV